MVLSSSHDLEADALYITLGSGTVARTVELDHGTLVDLDADGRPLGLEVIHPHRVWPVEEFIDRFGIRQELAEALRVSAAGFRELPDSLQPRRRRSTGSGKLARLRPVAA